MPYAAAQDMIDRCDATMLIQITDPTGQSVQTAKLDQALQDASDEIDSYLAARYALPFAEPPRRLLLLACDIALYKLLVLRPLGDMEDQRKRYEDAVKFLRSVADGTIQLGLSAENTPPPHTEGPVVEGPKRTFSRDHLREF